jgi:hypothetical protein
MKRLAAAVVAGLAVVFGTSAPASAVPAKDLNVSMYVVCDTGWHSLAIVVRGYEFTTDENPSTTHHQWAWGASTDGAPWQYSSWFEQYGQFSFAPRPITNMPPGTHSFYVLSSVDIGGQWQPTQTEYALHYTQYMGGFQTYTGTSCQT